MFKNFFKKLFGWRFVPPKTIEEKVFRVSIVIVESLLEAVALKKYIFNEIGIFGPIASSISILFANFMIFKTEYVK